MSGRFSHSCCFPFHRPNCPLTFCRFSPRSQCSSRFIFQRRKKFRCSAHSGLDLAIMRGQSHVAFDCCSVRAAARFSRDTAGMDEVAGANGGCRWIGNFLAGKTLEHFARAAVTVGLGIFSLMAVTAEVPLFETDFRGNQTLKPLGLALRENFRPGDTVVCWGKLPQGLAFYSVSQFLGWAQRNFRYGPYTNDPRAIELHRQKVENFEDRSKFPGDAFRFTIDEIVSLGGVVVRRIGDVTAIRPTFESITFFEFQQEMNDESSKHVPLFQSRAVAVPLPQSIVPIALRPWRDAPVGGLAESPG